MNDPKVRQNFRLVIFTPTVFCTEVLLYPFLKVNATERQGRSDNKLLDKH